MKLGSFDFKSYRVNTKMNLKKYLITLLFISLYRKIPWLILLKFTDIRVKNYR